MTEHGKDKRYLLYVRNFVSFSRTTLGSRGLRNDIALSLKAHESGSAIAVVNAPSVTFERLLRTL